MAKRSAQVLALRSDRRGPRRSESANSADDTLPGAPVQIVKMNDNEPMYQPSNIRILVDQTVEWQNNGQVSHSVTDDPRRATNPMDALLPHDVQPFYSGNVMPGGSYRHSFTRPGRYRYFCVNHEVDNMVGEIIVVAPAAPVVAAKPPVPANYSTTAAPVWIVKMNDDAPMYQPVSVQIRVGQTIEWENDGQVSHSVTDDPARATNPLDALLPAGVRPFSSGSIMPGSRFRHTFTKSGRYRYFCLSHEVDRMVGEVLVEPAAPPQETAGHSPTQNE